VVKIVSRFHRRYDDQCILNLQMNFGKFSILIGLNASGLILAFLSWLVAMTAIVYIVVALT
jgi:hypothetical protein